MQTLFQHVLSAVDLKRLGAVHMCVGKDAEIAEEGLEKANPPCGGTMISIIGVPSQVATHVKPLADGSRDVYSVDVEGYPLTIYPFFEKAKKAICRFY